MSSLWAMSLGCEIIPDMQSKCIIQLCKTVSVCNGSPLEFSTQLLRRNSRDNLSLNVIISVGVILCDKQILLQKLLSSWHSSGGNCFQREF